MSNRLPEPPAGIHYESAFLNAQDRRQLLSYLATLQPLWESRYSAHNPPPPGESQRQLLRPVYWLGGWQFACLNYYHPPKGIDFRCVEAEPYPEVMRGLVAQIEEKTRQMFTKTEIPPQWELNTCLINYYGSVFRDGKWQDVARVGEHKDYEPGPVGSISIGERALFQFVDSRSRSGDSRLIRQFWLEDSSLQIFGGETWKRKFFHRVQRVEKKGEENLAPQVKDFQTRRINLTFRYVPREHTRPLAEFPQVLREDLSPLIQKLSESSAFFRQA